MQDDPLETTPYRALQELGRGGMGRVLLAEHRLLGKRVVVKIMHDRLAQDPKLIERMRVEGQAMAALSRRSSHLVEISDLGVTAERSPYLVMEALSGRTLREELDGHGTLSVAMAVDLVRQVLAGLAVIHQAGIVHRDVKLDNIFLTDDGLGGQRVKLLDFGIVKVVSAAAGIAPTRYPTEQGQFIGTPRWSSPEQIRGRDVDARTDLYAVALVLYVLVCGRGPFDHAGAQVDLMRAHLFEEPRPPSAHAWQPIPVGLDGCLLRALAKAPDERFQSAEQFASALTDAVSSTGQPAPIASRWIVTEPIDRAAPDSPTAPPPPGAPRAEPPAAAHPPAPARVPPPRLPRSQAEDPTVVGELGPTTAPTPADAGPPTGAEPALAPRARSAADAGPCQLGGREPADGTLLSAGSAPGARGVPLRFVVLALLLVVLLTAAATLAVRAALGAAEPSGGSAARTMLASCHGVSWPNGPVFGDNAADRPS